jgi:2-polyprenyl-3-methyl-5-hydroxy-6-metoxy-1,4-benzoquinol methylase
MKPHNLANRFRQKRMKLFMELVSQRADRPLQILDVGGTAGYWHALPGLYGRQNVEITIVNLGEHEFDDENLKIRHGDACDLSKFSDNSFDVVHSNSVIEHVGRWPQMQAMAREIRRLAQAYFVQTPNFWFPLEPHYRLPLIQFLPRRQRERVKEAFFPGDSIELLTARQMRNLFPDAVVKRERFAGLTKSLIAVNDDLCR